MKKWAVWLACMLFSGMALAAVNINTASKEQLESLNGIGPSKAQAIIDYRTKNGPFKSIDDIKKVSGVGDATFEKIRGEISVKGATKVSQGASSGDSAQKGAQAPKPESKPKSTQAAKPAEPAKK
jgi:competence protein ComEA